MARLLVHGLVSMTYSCLIQKEGLNSATNRPWWVVKSDEYMIIKVKDLCLKIDKGTEMGRFPEKEIAVTFAARCGLTISRSDRDA